MALNTHKSNYIRVTLVAFLALFLSITSFAKLSPVAELNQAGLYGRIHTWNKKVRTSHKIKVDVPLNAPIIISDFHSNVGANGLKRSGKHHGVDIFAKTGTPIIAAADGRVIKAKTDRCWGPTILVSHGLDKNGKPFYALYGHVKNINVKIGQRIKRGQKIAEMGEDIFTTCGAGIHHLHFQISYNPRKIPLLGWGWANFVMDGAVAPNPHKYWTNGEGRITCFEKGRKYIGSGLTYPVPCDNTFNQRRSHETNYVQEKAKNELLKRTLLSSLQNALGNEALHQKSLAKKSNERLARIPVKIGRRDNRSKQERVTTSSLEGLWAEATKDNGF